MPSIIVSPDLGKSLVVRRGVVTVPQEMAVVGCSPHCNYDQPCPFPARIEDIPMTGRGLELELHEMGRAMVERLSVRGYEWLGGMRFHGPFVSRQLGEIMTDLARTGWQQTEAWANRDGERHPEHSLDFVHDYDGTLNGYMDYLLVSSFVLRNALTEIPDTEH